MRLEIPTFTRCCGCLPLRRGIITLGYLSLAFAVFVIWVEFSVGKSSWTDDTTGLFRGASFPAQKWLPILMYCVDIVFIIVLLIGAHTKRPNLIRVYYYYGIATTVAMLAVYLLAWPFRDQTFFSYYVIDVCTMFVGIVTQAYLLLLIRSELRKPREDHYCINHLTEVIGQPTNGVDPHSL